MVLQKTLNSLSAQSLQPDEIIIIDASEDLLTLGICKGEYRGLRSIIRHEKALHKGAAIQRMQGIKSGFGEFVLFLDDDIELEENCLHRLTECMEDPSVGGANAMVTNQYYHTPGKMTAFMYRLMSGKKLASYAGKCIGPAWNLLPQPSDEKFIQTEWLNTTCTLYRRAALPDPLFPPLFKGYSLMEDLALSIHVGKKWKLMNVPGAKIFHDSQPGSHKRSKTELSKMELVNRYYIMTRLLNRNRMSDHLKLFCFESWNIATSLSGARGWRNLIPVLAGKISALAFILGGHTDLKISVKPEDND